MSFSKVCIVCGKEFKVWGGRVKTALTCSRECRGKLDAKKYGEQRPSLLCKWCAKPFVSPPSQAHRRVYCSKVCAGAAKVGGTFRLVADGSITRHSDGYLLERRPDHPFNVSGYVLQHRLAMEGWMREVAPEHSFLVEVSGVKYLRRDIDVHHRNEVKDDNDRSNLMACTSIAHRDAHEGRPLMRGSVWPESGNEIDPVDRVVHRNCGECGKPLRESLSTVLRGGGKFCSRSCAAISRGRAKKLSRVNRSCVVCGASFEVWPSLLKSGRGKFCSNKCRHKSRIGRNPKETIQYS